MRTPIFRPIATLISLLLLAAVPAQASPIKFNDIVNVVGDLQRGGQIERLRLRAQDPVAPQILNPSSRSSATATAPGGQITSPLVSPALSGGEAAAPSLVSGTEIAPQQPQGQLQVFEQDYVDGTICDCGEIPTVGGGFPKWPFLALIPLICVTGICHDHDKVPPPECLTCEVCPTPTPTPPIPEPASLLLFGSGIVALSAGARRRYAKMRATRQAAALTEQ